MGNENATHALLSYETGALIDIKRKPKKQKTEGLFTMTYVKDEEALAKMKTLKGTDYKVFHMIKSRMEFGKDVRISQKFIAEELEIRPEQVSVAIKKLVAEGAITLTSVDGITAYSVPECDNGEDEMTSQQKNPNIEAGYKFATEAIESLCKTGVGDQPLLFYTAMIGTHIGNIAAHIGKGATLAMIDCIRELIELALPDDGEIQ